MNRHLQSATWFWIQSTQQKLIHLAVPWRNWRKICLWIDVPIADHDVRQTVQVEISDAGTPAQ